MKLEKVTRKSIKILDYIGPNGKASENTSSRVPIQGPLQKRIDTIQVPNIYCQTKHI